MRSGGQLLEPLKWLSSDFLPSVHPSSTWPVKRISKNSFTLVALPAVCKDVRDCLDMKERISKKHETKKHSECAARQLESGKRISVYEISALAAWTAMHRCWNSWKSRRHCARGKPGPPGEAPSCGKACMFPERCMPLIVKPQPGVASIIVQYGFAQEALLEYIRTMMEDFTCSVEISWITWCNMVFPKWLKITDLRYLKCKKWVFLIRTGSQLCFREQCGVCIII